MGAICPKRKRQKETENWTAANEYQGNEEPNIGHANFLNCSNCSQAVSITFRLQFLNSSIISISSLDFYFFCYLKLRTFEETNASQLVEGEPPWVWFLFYLTTLRHLRRVAYIALNERIVLNVQLGGMALEEVMKTIANLKVVTLRTENRKRNLQNYEAPHYAIFTILPPLPHSSFNIFSSTSCSKTPSIYDLLGLHY
jgi:hypothetical protein